MTEESVETLHLLGRWDLVVGVSGYAVRPPEARKKPRVCAFTTADVPKILALKPDLAVGFSDLQADIARDLVKAGLNVVIFNQRSVAEVLGVIRATGPLVGASAEADVGGAPRAGRAAARRARRLPATWVFEEWTSRSSAASMVEELVRRRRGARLPELRTGLAKDRIRRRRRSSAAPRPRRRLLVGRKANLVASRAPRLGRRARRAQRLVREIKSTYILQPGPAALTEGLAQLEALVREASASS